MGALSDAADASLDILMLLNHYDSAVLIFVGSLDHFANAQDIIHYEFWFLPGATSSFDIAGAVLVYRGSFSLLYSLSSERRTHRENLSILLEVHHNNRAPL